ncbi:hypothetical protein QJS10_CPA16g00270 [Acorus calamus]|uniref:Uncharacterized protein n=1 Tax=Acorus calamus TaxID=4465 RepID=A0AAV9D1A4_ACOCL|nr:hypothetical protein QJS10_CPA16g00270 [Acorus calamus]
MRSGFGLPPCMRRRDFPITHQSRVTWGGNHVVTRLGSREVHGLWRKTRSSSTSSSTMAYIAGDLSLSSPVDKNILSSMKHQGVDEVREEL